MIPEKIQLDDGILYDLGTVMTGKFLIRLTVQKPEELLFFYGPYHDFLKFRMEPEITPDGRGWRAAHENVITCRYFKIICAEALSDGVTLEFEPEMREVREYGQFISDRPLLNAIFRISAETVHLCMLKHFRGNATIRLQLPENQRFAEEWRGETTDYVLVDGARRDREVWVGDLLPEVRSAVLLFSDTEVVKNSFAAILSRIRPDGQIPASSISNQTFYEYNCWFAVVLYEYYMLSGDSSYVEGMMDTLLTVMHFITTLLNSDGLLRFGKMQTWAWTLKREGYVTSSHCVIYRAFTVTSRLCDEFGREKEAKRYRTLANRLKLSINRYAYDVSEKLYLDECRCAEQRYSLDANCLAILFGVADETVRPELLGRIKEKFWSPYGSLLLSPKEEPDGQNWVHNDHIWPFAVSFEVEARFLCGDYEGAAELIKRTWGTMIEHGADTFWEIVDASDGSFMKRRIVDADDDRDTYNSACHGWSAGLPGILLRYIAGFSPETPGFREFLFKPSLYGMTRLSVRFPSAVGLIEANLFRSEDTVTVRLTLPEGCTGKTPYPLYHQSQRIEDGAIRESGVYTVILPKTPERSEKDFSCPESF